MPGDRLPSTIPPPQASWKDGFPRRLGVFLVGIAFGFIVLGFFQRMKQAAAQRDQAEQAEQAEPAPSPAARPGGSDANTP